MNNVLVLGGVAYNTMIYLHEFPQPHGQTVFSQGAHDTLGSSGAGKALNLNGLGLDVTLFALIGEDERGEKVKAHLRDAGVEFVYNLDPAGTKHHVNLMDQNGERISIFVNGGTYEIGYNEATVEALIRSHDVVAMNIYNYCRHMIPVCRKHHKPIWVDIHDYDGHNPHHADFINGADYLFLSSTLMPDYRAFMEEQIAAGKRLVVCTHGRDGSTALTPDGDWIETPALTTFEQVDTNGAGDSFFSGVLYGFLRGYPLAQCLRLGSIVAGLCITSKELAYPDLSESLVAAAYEQHYEDALPVV